MDLQVTVKITLDDRLYDLLDTVMPKYQHRLGVVAKKEANKVAVKDAIEVKEVTVAPVAEAQTPATVEPAEPYQAGATAEEKKAEQAEPETPAKPMGTGDLKVQVRRHIDATVTRLMAGLDEATAKRVKAELYNEFKRIALQCGAPLPTKIPTQQGVDNFGRDCAALCLTAEGKLTNDPSKLPF